MCNRYTLKSLDALKSFPGDLTAPLIADWQPRHNVALTSLMPVIAQSEKPTLEAMHFGFDLPARSTGEKAMRLGNARAETALEKPTFRDAALHRRCLVLADGFYEWEKSGSARLPHYFSLITGAPFFFAGLWAPPHDDTPATFCIVTTTANALLEPIHNRMPVILGPNSGPLWLGDQPLDRVQFARLCRPLPAEKMTSHRVSPKMSSVRHEGPDCVTPVPADHSASQKL